MDIKVLADGLNNALFVYGRAIAADYFGCESHLPQQLQELSHEELERRFEAVKELYENIESLEKEGYNGIYVEGRYLFNVGS
ncbi:MAG: hypothetical protein NC218_07345 [Acetobacter sp.]|nr:hypothetical protein [Acetobacter sp.]